MTLAARLLPRRIATPLFGDRQLHGLVPNRDDPDWHIWQRQYLDFYQSTQKSGIGRIVNDAGYKVLQAVDMEGLEVCEIGPGSLPHREFWRGSPALYTAIDIKPEFLAISKNLVRCPFRGIVVEPECHELPLPDASIDILLSFYSFEHLHPIQPYLDEYARLLKPGGKIVGAIPNEGGLAWGLGRFLTSRRWIRANTDIDYDKIICWEHPNFCDTILQELNKRFRQRQLVRYPNFGIPSADLTLVSRFVFEKPNSPCNGIL